ncbi:unnamed protein product [Ilex paraguariensis]|uniref:Uncharacterized protein n=1 Tax=Ilex paraguariensis TaxID=185542 RepID=A0ABC8TSC7_9AQUA
MVSDGIFPSHQQKMTHVHSTRAPQGAGIVTRVLDTKVLKSSGITTRVLDSRVPRFHPMVTHVLGTSGSTESCKRHVSSSYTPRSAQIVTRILDSIPLDTVCD